MRRYLQPEFFRPPAGVCIVVAMCECWNRAPLNVTFSAAEQPTLSKKAPKQKYGKYFLHSNVAIGMVFIVRLQRFKWPYVVRLFLALCSSMAINVFITQPWLNSIPNPLNRIIAYRCSRQMKSIRAALGRELNWDANKKDTVGVWVCLSAKYYIARTISDVLSNYICCG